MPKDRRDLPELWGGVECTLNRVGPRYHDQLERSRHLRRLDDVERFAALGLSALRVPLLWERSCPAGGAADFGWVEPLIRRVTGHGLRIIAGLLHHGSGPADTQLLDPEFPRKLARYAEQVARRFPEIADYTPVNEPLTTARFSALYGHWYPHARDTRSFLHALVNECRGTQLAMEAIRRLRPDARLVQTEDIARIRSSPALGYQAEYENHRRFLGYDLLCGRVAAGHPLYAHLLEHGIAAPLLQEFCDRPCPPDLIGVNYYFTSDRFLDEDVTRHPPEARGGNGRHSYVDTEACRVPGQDMIGHAGLIRELWQRYRIPMAITELHAGCTREEQLRWFHEGWQAACSLRSEGVPVLAVTAWALLGSYDWDSLVCREAGHYETGAFDLRGAQPRKTALAHMIGALAHAGSFDHPVLHSGGWWRRAGMAAAQSGEGSARPILITGSSGRLGTGFVRACQSRGLSYVALDRSELDITQAHAVRELIARVRPWAVVNAAGLSCVDRAQREPASCARINTDGAVLLAEACRTFGARLLTFSSDQVFDGARRTPYLEHDEVRPLSVFGESLAAAERAVLAIDPQAFVVRAGALFGAPCRGDFLTRALTEWVQGRTVRPARGQIFSPTYVPHLVDASLDLLIDGAHGRWHLASQGEESWSGLLSRVTSAAQRRTPDELQQEPSDPLSAPRPDYSVLSSAHGAFMKPLEEGIACYLRSEHVASLVAEVCRQQSYLSVQPRACITASWAPNSTRWAPRYL